MKLLAKDLSTGQSAALTKIDVDSSTGDVTTLGVINGIGMELPAQGTQPANLSKGVWINTSNQLRFYNGTTDYEVAHSGTALAGGVTGTLGATVVGNDTHYHSNSFLSGVPGAGIDTTAIHSGDSAGGDLGGTYPTNITVTKSTAAFTVGTLLQLHDFGAGASGASATGDMWISDPSASMKVLNYWDASAGVGKIVVDNTTAFVGDVTGTYGATLVSKIQGDDVYASIAPTDGQVLTWDNGNSRWDAATPSGGSTYYKTLDATAD